MRYWKIYLQRYFDSAGRYFNFTVCRAPEFGDAWDFSWRMSSRSRSDPANLRLVVESLTGFHEETFLYLFPRALLNPTFIRMEQSSKRYFLGNLQIRFHFPCLSSIRYIWTHARFIHPTSSRKLPCLFSKYSDVLGFFVFLEVAPTDVKRTRAIIQLSTLITDKSWEWKLRHPSETLPWYFYTLYIIIYIQTYIIEEHFVKMF